VSLGCWVQLQQHYWVLFGWWGVILFSALIVIDAVLDLQGLADHNDRTCLSLLLGVYHRVQLYCCIEQRTLMLGSIR
jgi:hypothetical protein